MALSTKRANMMEKKEHNPREPVILTLETITPLVLAGADSKALEQKLRPPSFKGIIRYWWRVMQTEQEIAKLAAQEAELFGGSGKKAGKSNMSIRFMTGEGLEKMPYCLLPHKSKARCQAIKPGQTFTCQLHFRTPTYQKTLLAAFHFALIVGGFGRRARRGFGVVADTASIFNSIDDVVNEINQLGATLSSAAPFQVKQTQDGDMLLCRNVHIKGRAYPGVLAIYLGHKGATGYDALLKLIGDASYKDNALGSFKPRMASPVVASVVKIGETYHPIVTLLSSHFPKKLYVKDFHRKQQTFIEKILTTNEGGMP